MDTGDYSPTISVGTVDAEPSDFTVIENVSDLWAEFPGQLTSAIEYLIDNLKNCFSRMTQVLLSPLIRTVSLYPF